MTTSAAAAITTDLNDAVGVAPPATQQAGGRLRGRRAGAVDGVIVCSSCAAAARGPGCPGPAPRGVRGYLTTGLPLTVIFFSCATASFCKAGPSGA